MSAVLKLVSDSPVTEKVCTKCKDTKSVSEFYTHKVHGLTPRCKECTKEGNRESRKKHNHDSGLQHIRYKKWREALKADPERHQKYKDKKNEWNRSEKYFDGYYKRKFGISFADVTSMLAKQNGLCANISCSKPISVFPAEGTAKAVVDHCHASGKVRSAMCVRCNSLLGHVENSPSIVNGLLDYLNKQRN